MTRTIGAVFQKAGHRLVKFTDGTECVARDSDPFVAPLEVGVEAECMTEERKSGGRAYDLLVFWGTAEPPSPMGAAVAAQAPLKPKAEPKPETNGKPSVRIDPRDRSIIAQVALKEAREYAANRAALGASKSMDSDAQVVRRAKAWNKALLEMVGAE